MGGGFRLILNYQCTKYDDTKNRYWNWNQLNNDFNSERLFIASEILLCSPSQRGFNTSSLWLCKHPQFSNFTYKFQLQPAKELYFYKEIIHTVPKHFYKIYIEIKFIFLQILFLYKFLLHWSIFFLQNSAKTVILVLSSSCHFSRSREHINIDKQHWWLSWLTDWLEGKCQWNKQHFIPGRSMKTEPPVSRYAKIKSPPVVQYIQHDQWDKTGRTPSLCSVGLPYWRVDDL